MQAMAARKEKKRVRFQVTADPGAEVFVAGSFNGWNPAEFRLKEESFRLKPGSNLAIYAGVVPVVRGEHEYKFVVNGHGLPDPGNKQQRTNDRGGMNSVLRA
jgi:hypothetical protein